MKISELITLLEEYKQEYGDIDVLCYSVDGEGLSPEKEDNRVRNTDKYDRPLVATDKYLLLGGWR